jgi:hypothetical protein
VSIAVLCVSRDNPGALMEAFASFCSSKMEAETRFVVVLDENDPKMAHYMEALEGSDLDLVVVPQESTGNMNLALNYAAVIYAGKVDVVGFIGDDHRFRTKGWDRVVDKVLSDEGGGFVYGNDLYMGDYLPTQVFISSPIVRALGWMGLPSCRHLYLDNTWKYLGEAIDRLYYLPDVVIEHMHPAAGKADWDENHKRVNTSEMYDHDRVAFETWMATQGSTDVEKIRAAVA